MHKQHEQVLNLFADDLSKTVVLQHKLLQSIEKAWANAIDTKQNKQHTFLLDDFNFIQTAYVYTLERHSYQIMEDKKDV